MSTVDTWPPIRVLRATSSPDPAMQKFSFAQRACSGTFHCPSAAC